MDSSSFTLAGVSIQGSSHKKSDPPIPRQDAEKSGILENGLHVLIVSDGAGSSRMSHVASAFCTDALFSILQRTDFSAFMTTPSDEAAFKEQWHAASKEMFNQVRNALIEKASLESLAEADLNCTLLLVIKMPWGFLSANIGDGRSGYSNGTPFPLTVPFMTFTAGATFFLIKEGWERIFRSYVHVVEKPESIQYFFATSDGCQDFIIDWSHKGPQNGIYDDVLGDEAFYDSNVPYQPFFEGLIKSLKEVITAEERYERFRKLIEEGIYVLNEGEKELKSLSNPSLDDDKTFVLFYR